MSGKYQISNEEILLFHQAIGKTKKLNQDTVVHERKKNNFRLINKQKIKQESINNEFYFSDEFQPLLYTDPVRYLRSGANSNELKKLKRGFYEPELFLDLHGLTQLIAKQEIAALISTCLHEQISCACIMHGHGKNILKKQIPMWLAQHPDIIGFHQAPKAYGGNAALLILFDLGKSDDPFSKR